LTVAGSPEVAAALQREDPSEQLQPLAEQIRSDADVSFVVIMAPDRTRYTHPDPGQIGRPYIGTIGPALQGDTLTETFTGTLGPSIRSVAPVFANPTTPGGPIVGLVSVGITQDRVADAFRGELPALISAVVAALLLGAAGSWFLARRIRAQTFGLEPAELARIYEHHDAVLHAIREGLLVITADRRLMLANDEARALLGLGEEHTGRPLGELPITGPLAQLLADGTAATDVVHPAGDRLVVVNQMPAHVDGRNLGTVVTLRDRTELAAVASELSATRALACALRAHAHETANRLHTIATLIELGDLDAAMRLTTSHASGAQALTDRLVGQVGDPVFVALLLGKLAEAHERSVDLRITEDTALPPDLLDPDDLVTLVGNLIDNAIEATQLSPPPRHVEVSVRAEHDELVIQVSDNGPGLSDEEQASMFDMGWSTKPAEPGRAVAHGIGLALVQQVAQRLGGSVTATNDAGAVITVRLPATRMATRRD